MFGLMGSVQELRRSARAYHRATCSFSKAAIDKSVDRQLGTTPSVPEFEDDYEGWLEHCGGAYTIKPWPRWSTTIRTSDILVQLFKTAGVHSSTLALRSVRSSLVSGLITDMTLSL